MQVNPLDSIGARSFFLPKLFIYVAEIQKKGVYGYGTDPGNRCL
jgi:hypothetical protein